MIKKTTIDCAPGTLRCNTILTNEWYHDEKKDPRRQRAPLGNGIERRRGGGATRRRAARHLIRLVVGRRRHERDQSGGV